MCGLARFVCSLVTSGAQTASVQWLERTLDDSANRRLTLPQAFLGTDAVLRLALNISRGLVVNPSVVNRHVLEVLPFMATENILMAAVALGGDRQALHERIRQHSMAVSEADKSGSKDKALLPLLKSDPAFAKVDFQSVCDPRQFVGRAPEQVVEFIANEIKAIRDRYPIKHEPDSDIAV
jgi:adenylosuccinate lyase